ncbi:ribosomal protein S18-alanine N-acetyltransferase [Shewanella algae]|nr:ribosomal protein S18-alanine N-acetyltransferase [Shewanella algae]MBO2674085.1 ribosomal protein S18-alanine N-acetyltransferase [Shewanella algae]
MMKIEQLAHEFPWSEATLGSCFGRFYRALGLYLGQELQGFCLLQVLFEEATLMNICIAPAAQGRGLGRQLLQAAIELLKETGVERLLLEVRVGNAAAIALYRRLGFIETGSRADYYQTKEGREDALLMELSLHSS